MSPMRMSKAEEAMRAVSKSKKSSAPARVALCAGGIPGWTQRVKKVMCVAWIFIESKAPSSAKNSHMSKVDLGE